MVRSVFRKQVELPGDGHSSPHVVLAAAARWGATLHDLNALSPSSHQSHLEGEEQNAEASVLECISGTFS